MKRSTKRAVLTVLASVATSGSLIGLTSTSAFAINEVPCDSDGFVKITIHGPPTQEVCYANGGAIVTPDNYPWVDKIWTGNNRVQWYGDGRWQPDQPIGQWTTFTWPHVPGGVRIEGIRIV